MGKGGGFFSLFTNIGKVADARAQKAADGIAAEHAVDFGKQDLAQLRSDIDKVKGNIGSIKGEIAILEDKKHDFENQIKKHDDDAKALMAAKNEQLAEQHCLAAESLEKQVTSIEEALKVQRGLLEEQQATRRDLENALQQAETDLVTLKAMTDAASANEKLATITSNSGASALSSFNTRKEEARKRLIKSQTMKESGTSESLENQTRQALGTSGVSARMARLKSTST
ncbi:MAG: PspA/IM30 family protein [Candidatus Nanoarchaeia archaeon]|jgi:phage shock protein A|nr:PspA/IM30 family protein [Candidatus Nanoarchaeia archaeon]